MAKENRKTVKVKRALELNTPILHYNWIYYSQMFFTKLNANTFDLIKLNKNQVENKDFIEGNLVNDNKEYSNSFDSESAENIPETTNIIYIPAYFFRPN